MILAIWAPVGGRHHVARDGRLLITAAISAAVNLRLDEAAALSIGTGRVPHSRRIDLDQNVADWSPAPSIESGRDQRLALSARLYALAESGFRLRFARRADIDIFYREVTAVLDNFDDLSITVAPLSAISEHEALQFFAVHLELRLCRLLVLKHCITQLRQTYTARPRTSSWHRAVVHNGLCLPVLWGMDVFLLTQDILAAALARPPAELRALPDSAFAALGAAAAFLVRVKLAAHAAEGTRIPGAGDMLLARTQALLADAACAPGHIAARCAQLVESLVHTYEAVVLQGKAPGAESGEGQLGEGQGVGTEAHTNARMSLELDSDFWALFMDNLAADVQMPYPPSES
ncbi:hypothetical protein HWV62_32315 [Athelia sp. TMB]|nr:hypothetical protein HWV62_32315 [Athelia sp. TMB]